jgi:hypothetical protein
LSSFFTFSWWNTGILIIIARLSKYSASCNTSEIYINGGSAPHMAFTRQPYLYSRHVIGCRWGTSDGMILIPSLRKMVVLIMYYYRGTITHSARVIASVKAAYLIHYSVFYLFYKSLKGWFFLYYCLNSSPSYRSKWTVKYGKCEIKALMTQRS